MLRFKVHHSYSHPFQYFEGEGALPKDLLSSLIDWLHRGAPWKLVEADFYEQYEFDLMSVNLPAEFNLLTAPSALMELRGNVEKHFQIDLLDQVDVTAHKLVGGQRIRLHNDYLDYGETHRLILQLNPHWSAACGGFLMVFNGSDANDIHRVIPPRLNSLFGFAIGPSSFHAVSTVKGGERLTLVYSFYERR